MSSEFFKSDFKFEKYINDRLLEISDEGERRAFKEVMQRTLIPFYSQVEEAYTDLEERLEKAVGINEGTYEVVTGIQRKCKIDSTDDSLTPMVLEDLKDDIIDVEDLFEGVKQGNGYRVMTVFLKVETELCQKIVNQDRSFLGRVFTDLGEYQVTAKLQRNLNYVKKVEELYHIFEHNGIGWNTISMPYLFKFFDVIVVQTDCPYEDVEIEKIVIDFEELTDCVYYDMVPIWNIRYFEEKTGAYPDFAVDRIHYEHCIFQSRLRKNCEYLIKNEEIHLWNIYLQNCDLHIICDAERPVTWDLVEFSKVLERNEYEFPLCFNGGCLNNGNRIIHTMAEVKRFVRCLGYNDFELIRVIRDDQISRHVINTYSMDCFLEDEIRISEARPILRFVFRIRRDDFLTYDFMSYIISRIQWQLPEFLCVGELE